MPAAAGRRLRLLESGDRVVIGERQHVDAGRGGALHQLGRASASRRSSSNGYADRSVAYESRRAAREPDRLQAPARQHDEALGALEAVARVVEGIGAQQPASAASSREPRRKPAKATVPSRNCTTAREQAPWRCGSRSRAHLANFARLYRPPPECRRPNTRNTRSPLMRRKLTLEFRRTCPIHGSMSNPLRGPHDE